MNDKLYWKQRLPLIALQGLAMLGLAMLLSVNGVDGECLVFIVLIWLGIGLTYLVSQYFLRRRQLNDLLKLTYQLEESYLITEVMDKPWRAEDAVYYRILRLACKSMLEQIGAIKQERAAYQMYIEQWVHEAKTPLTALQLWCVNHPSDIADTERLELERLNHIVEQALYYARSEQPEKDYLVRRVPLLEVVHQAIGENKYLLRQHGVTVEVGEITGVAYTDEKWLRFMLNQLISNAVKYRQGQPVLKFYTQSSGAQIILTIQDNGLGIAQSDLPRIFEKGFTGCNGRLYAPHATGMGLYLCKRLADKLGIGLEALSDGAGTTIRLIFIAAAD